MMIAMKRFTKRLSNWLLLASLLSITQQSAAQCSTMELSAQNYKVCVDNSVVLILKGAPSGSNLVWQFGNQQVVDTATGQDTVRFIGIRTGNFEPYVNVKTPFNLNCKVELPFGKKLEVVGKPNKMSMVVTPDSNLCQLKDLVTIKAQGGSSDLLYTFLIETHGNAGLDYLYRSRSKKPSVTTRFYHEGYKKVIMEVENANGCKTSVVYDSLISAFDVPAPSFTVTDPKTCDKKVVDFKSTLSNSTSVNYEWTFKGGTPSKSVLPDPKGVVFDGEGLYEVSLIISNGKGCNKTITKTNAVVIGEKEIIDLNISDNDLCTNEQISIKQIGSDLSKGTISWNLSGATVAFTNNDNTLKQLAYKKAGAYSVGLSYSFGGCVTEAIYKDTITVNSVNAAFELSAYCDCQPNEIQFTNKSTSTYKDDKLEYSWTVRNSDNQIIFYSKDKNPKYEFSKNGKYLVKLDVISEKGCSSSKTLPLKFSPLKAAFRVSTDRACLGEKVTATINESITCKNELTTTLWTVYNSNGKPITKQSSESFSYAFNKPGKYALELYVKNATGCEDFAILFYAVDVFQLQSTVITNEDYLCANEEVNLEMKNGPYAVSSNNTWLVIDSTTQARYTGTGNKLNFPITQPGTYDVLMIASRNSACADTVILKDQFFVSGAKANIYTGIKESCVPLEDHVRAELISNIQHTNPNNTVSYEWNSSAKSGITFEDPKADSTKVTITESDNYNVRLKVTNGEGCVTFFDKAKAFEAGVVARFTSNSTACIDIPLKTNNRSYVNANDYKWYASDTTVLIKPKKKAVEPRLVFTEVGTYAIVLIAQNDLGCIDTFTKNINVIDFDFKFTSEESNSLLCAPALVKFNIEHTNVDSFLWSFGDGKEFGTSQIETGHFYDILDLNPNNEYKFDVSLVAFSKYGCSDTLTLSEFIKLAGPRPNFIADPTTGSKELDVTFKELNDGVRYYLFDYGDKSSVDSNELNMHKYIISDTTKLFEEFYPKMVAFDDRGCSRSIIGEPIRLYNGANARFAADTFEACADVAVRFKNFSTLADSFEWFINGIDTAVSYERSPELSFKEGRHSITLKAYNIEGEATIEKKVEYITVYKNPTVEYTSDNSSYCINYPVEFIDRSYGDNEIQERFWTFDFPKGSSDTSSLINPTHYYNKAGKYDVKLSVVDKFGCRASKVFEDAVTIALPTEIKHEGLAYASFISNNVLELAISNNDTFGTHGFLLYNKEQELKPIGVPNEKPFYTGKYQVRLPNSSTSFQIHAINDCKDTVAIGTAHKPVYLNVQEGSNNFFPNLSWSKYKGWNDVKAYEVYRSLNGENHELLATVSSNDTIFIDSLICKNYYDYYVKAVQNDGPHTAKSTRDTISPKYLEPTGITDLFTTTVVDNNYILTTWNKHNHPQVNKYQISRSDPSFGYIDRHAIVTDTFYLDSIEVFVDKNIYSYTITGVDYCNSQADPSITSNSIVVALSRTENSLDIEWNLFEEWPKDRTYYYLERGIEGKEFETILSGAELTSYKDDNVFSDLQDTFKYRIKAVYGNKVAYSNVIREYPDLKVFIPNAFTPNGDGINDLYKVSGSGAINGTETEFDNFRIVIINRWGETVFETNDIYKGWDGTYKGINCPIGTYVYHVEFRDKKGKFKYYQGNITLIK